VEPTFADVLAAAKRIGRHLRPTPLYRYTGLDDLTGAQVWVKHENHQPTGAFKVRAGINVLSCLTDEQRRGGVMAASTGNHGVGVAYAARLFGVRAVVYVPEQVNPAKADTIRGLGAEVVVHGRDFDEARVECERVAAEQGSRYVHAASEPLVIAGNATETLEILTEQPDLDAIVVPVGGGSGAAGACLVAKTVNPSVEVIAVQAEAAPAAFESWRAHELREAPMRTSAEAQATGSAFELTQQILGKLLDDFVLVSEDGLRTATRHMIEKTRNLVEPGAAAPQAAMLADPDRFAGRRIAVVCSGGNISPAQLRDVLA
jgi:threonine dehydratase